jgi:hypothetical protein
MEEPVRAVSARRPGDEPPPGRPRTISDEQIEALITKMLESTPADAAPWSTRSMTKEIGLNQTAVSRIWRAFARALSVALPCVPVCAASFQQERAYVWAVEQFSSGEYFFDRPIPPRNLQ